MKYKRWIWMLFFGANAAFGLQQVPREIEPIDPSRILHEIYNCARLSRSLVSTSCNLLIEEAIEDRITRKEITQALVKGMRMRRLSYRPAVSSEFSIRATAWVDRAIARNNLRYCRECEREIQLAREAGLSEQEIHYLIGEELQATR
jgi:hypothetical protein